DNRLVAVATEVAATLGGGGVAVGVRDGSLGFSVDAMGLALEAQGGIFFDGGDFANVAASRVALRINQTGQEWTGDTLAIGDLSYTFAWQAASTAYFAGRAMGFEASLVDGIALGGD